jgi:hypothetical protein
MPTGSSWQKTTPRNSQRWTLMDPSFVPARVALALAYQGKGDMAKAM